MALKLVVISKVRVPVKAEIKGEDGKPVLISFTLVCKRLKQSEINAVMGGADKSLNDFFRDTALDWEDVVDSDGSILPFSAAALEDVFEAYTGLSQIAFRSYVKEVSAVAKN